MILINIFGWYQVVLECPVSGFLEERLGEELVEPVTGHFLFDFHHIFCAIIILGRGTWPSLLLPRRSLWQDKPTPSRTAGLFFYRFPPPWLLEKACLLSVTESLLTLLCPVVCYQFSFYGALGERRVICILRLVFAGICWHMMFKNLIC